MMLLRVTWGGRDYQLTEVDCHSQEAGESLQTGPHDQVREQPGQVGAGRPAQLQADGQQPVERGQHGVKEQVGAVDVEGGQAPHQEGDLGQLSYLALQSGGQGEVQQGRQGEDNPALEPTWGGGVRGAGGGAARVLGTNLGVQTGSQSPRHQH